MPEREEADQAQHFCRNCGSQARAGNAYYTSCVARFKSKTNSVNKVGMGPVVPRTPPNTEAYKPREKRRSRCTARGRSLS